jgi:hypothetical protein
MTPLEKAILVIGAAIGDIKSREPNLTLGEKEALESLVEKLGTLCLEYRLKKE